MNAMLVVGCQLKALFVDKYGFNREVSWANKKKIKRVYELCKMISEDTGAMHHVDHIIPLIGKNISGLHVHTNLQILPASENFKKNNKFLPAP